MPDLYYIPGFEPDDIRDIAKSALRQVRERHVTALNTILDKQVLNLSEPYEVAGYISQINQCQAAQRVGAFAAYHIYRPQRLSVAGFLPHLFGDKTYEFDCQLASADHGDNVATTSLVASKKAAQ